MKRLLLLVFCCAASMLAADISGTWKGTADASNGSLERTFRFKQDGEKLSGETSSEMLGKSVITDGKVSGDNVSFTISVTFENNELKLSFNGKIDGDEIQFHVEGADGAVNVDYVAKKT